MSTLILLDSLAVGGTQKKSVRLANELSARGESISLAYLQEPAILVSEIDNRITTICLHRKGKFSFLAFRKLRRFVLENRISVILCMNLYPLLYAALLKFLFGFQRLKVILAINTTEFERERDRWFMLIYAPLIRMIEGVIYGCEYQKSLWQRKYRLKKVKSHVIYNGVDANFFDATGHGRNLRHKLHMESRFVIGCVGRLDPEKNHAALLEVVGKLKDAGKKFDVILVGTGPERERLENLSVNLGIDEQVHFLGHLDDVRIAYAAMDVFVLPSVSVETFSNAALEAMAMSLPVVLSDIAGAPEMISNEENGFLYNKCDLRRLSDILIRIQSNPDLAQRIGREARNIAIVRFSFTSMVDAYKAVLSEI